MNYRTKDKIIEALITSKEVYLKNTGISVGLDFMESDRFSKLKNTSYCTIYCLTTPTSSALKLFNTFHISKNRISNIVECCGCIEIKNLSLVPYESRAGKLLYSKKKVRKS